MFFIVFYKQFRETSKCIFYKTMYEKIKKNVPNKRAQTNRTKSSNLVEQVDF